jgi:hypothetical protein
MQTPAASPNDVTERPRLWRRFSGDDWAAFDALPPRLRQRLQEHSYDGWAVNALMLWRLFRRRTGSSARAERRLLNHIDRCEALERQDFAAAHAARWGTPLPHQAAGATVLRYDAARPRRQGRAARLTPTRSSRAACS